MKNTKQTNKILISIFLFFAFVSIFFGVANFNKTVYAQESENLNNEIQIEQNNTAVDLPSQYSLRDDYMIYTTNQSQQGLCWDFAASTCLSTTFMKQTNEYIDFSEGWQSLAYAYNSTNGNTVPGDGGSIFVFRNVVQEYGLVLEQDLPYQDSYYISLETVNHDFEYYSQFANKEIFKDISLVKFADINYYPKFSKEERDATNDIVKQHILQYGAAVMSIPAPSISSKSIGGKTIYYEKPDVPLSGGHDVCIIGWDDNFEITYNSKTYKGAWIILNSWGNTSQYQGVFMIMYDDKNVESMYGFEYNQDTTSSEIYFNDKIISSNASYKTDAGKFYTPFTTTKKETLQKNIFYQTNKVDMIYQYQASKDTYIKDIQIYKSSLNVTNDFNISVNSKNKTFKIKSDSVDVGAYKIIVSYGNEDLEDENINAFYVCDGTEIEIVEFGTSCLHSNNNGYFHLYNNLNFADDKIMLFSNYNTSVFSIPVIFATYSDVLDITTSNNLCATSLQSYTNYQRGHFTISYDSSYGTDQIFEFVIKSKNNFERTFYVEILYSSEYINVSWTKMFYQLNGATFNPNSSKMIIYGNESFQNDDSTLLKNVIQVPQKKGYKFLGWYYDSKFKSPVKKIDGKYCVDNIFVKHCYIDSYVYWSGYFKNYYYPNNSLCLYAKWKKITYTITATSNLGGDITPLGSSVVDMNSSFEYEFKPNSGKYISKIVVDGIELDTKNYNITGNNVYTFDNVNCDHTIYVEFDNYYYNLYCSCNSFGTLSKNGKSQTTVGKDCTVKIYPNVGYHISKIVIDDLPLDSSTFETYLINGYTFKNIKDDHTIYVEFSINTFTITATSNSGGTLTPLGDSDVDINTSKSYQFEPSQGNFITKIVIDGVEENIKNYNILRKNTYNFKNIVSNHTIYVEFDVYYFKLYTNCDSHGTLSCMGETTTTNGQNLNVNIYPNEGYHISKIVIDDLTLDSSTYANYLKNGYTFENIKDNHTMNVEYEINKYSIAVNCEFCNYSCEKSLQDILHGEDRVLDLQISDDYKIKYVTINDSTYDVHDNQIILNDISENLNINICTEERTFFEKNAVTIIVSTITGIITLGVVVPICISNLHKAKLLKTAVSVNKMNLNSLINSKPSTTNKVKDNINKHNRN